MDDQQWAERINKECDTGRPDDDHDNADTILIELLRFLGFNKTVDAWMEVDKWYS